MNSQITSLQNFIFQIQNILTKNKVFNKAFLTLVQLLYSLLRIYQENLPLVH